MLCLWEVSLSEGGEELSLDLHALWPRMHERARNCMHGMRSGRGQGLIAFQIVRTYLARYSKFNRARLFAELPARQWLRLISFSGFWLDYRPLVINSFDCVIITNFCTSTLEVPCYVGRNYPHIENTPRFWHTPQELIEFLACDFMLQVDSEIEHNYATIIKTTICIHNRNGRFWHGHIRDRDLTLTFITQHPHSNFFVG